MKADAPQQPFESEGRISTPRTHHVLWTGGFDSTFRVLSLLYSGLTVRPYYLVETDRRGLMQELAAMVEIRRAVSEVSPPGRLLSLRLTLLDEVPDDLGVAEAFSTIRRCFYLGSQYRWLACFAYTLDDRSLELCVHRDDRAYACVSEYLRSAESSGDFGGGSNLIRAYGKLFGKFGFPILEMTKVDMWAVAEGHGFDEILEMTWFCHKPTRWGRPCGQCNPCRYTIQEGFGWRISWWRRVVGGLNPVVVLRQWAVHRPNAYRILRKVSGLFRGTANSRNSDLS